MKAKEWAVKVNDESVPLTETLKGFFGEILAAARKNGSTHVSLDNAYREQEAKFRALCRLTGKLAPSMWVSLCRQYVPKQVLAEIDHIRKFGREVVRRNPKRHPKKAA